MQADRQGYGPGSLDLDQFVVAENLLFHQTFLDRISD